MDVEVKGLLAAAVLIICLSIPACKPTPLSDADLRALEDSIILQLEEMGFMEIGDSRGSYGVMPNDNTLGRTFCSTAARHVSAIDYSDTLDLKEPLGQRTIAHELIHADQCNSGRMHDWYVKGLEEAFRAGRSGPDLYPFAWDFMKRVSEIEAYREADKWLHTYGYD